MMSNLPGYKVSRRQREDKSTLTEPRCPFCEALIERPTDVSYELGEIYGGRCVCGAVYTCDPTGRNLGEALMDALVLLTGFDWQEALSLTPEVDYEERILNYDVRNHKLIPRAVMFGVRSYTAKILFLRRMKN